MLIVRLRKKENFSETEKNIADYIINHGDDLAHMTVRELADACYTAPNTIMRFCRKLGYDGFRAFKVAYIKELESSASQDEFLDINRPFYIGQSTSKIARTMLNLQEKALHELVNTLNYRDLEKTASLLTNADTIFLYGHGDSLMRINSFMNKMFKINKKCISASGAYEEAGMSYNASAKDAALFVSYRGGSNLFVRCNEILKKKNCPVIVLSADIRSDLNQNCDVWLKIPDRENSGDNIGTFYSHACFDYILNLLYSLVYAAMYTKNHNHKIDIDAQTKK